MMKIFDGIHRELVGWKCWEVVYIFSCTAAIGIISSVLGGNVLDISSAVAGTFYTMLAGKGKISCYYFGIFNSAAYGYITFGQRLYGDMMLNWGCYLPMMFAGIFFWRRKMDETNCVIKNSLSWYGKFITFSLCAVAIAVYAQVLHHFGDSQPVVDAVTTVLSVAAMILTVKRCVEQWLMWIAVNALSVVMWVRVYLRSGDSVATLLWWMIMLVTGIIFYIQWRREMAEKTAVKGFPENPVRQSDILSCRPEKDI